MQNFSARLFTVALTLVLVNGCNSEPKQDGTTIEIDVDESIVSGKGDENAEPIANQSASNEENGKEVPVDFPSDIPIAEYMLCTTITKVRDDYMITFHAKDKSIDEIVEWFEGKLAENGWSESGTPSKSEAKAILAYKKGDRTCGLSITNFVLDAAMQRDESTCGITIQTQAVAVEN